MQLNLFRVSVILFITQSCLCEQFTSPDDNEPRRNKLLHTPTLTCSSISYKFRTCNIPTNQPEKQLHHVWVVKKYSRSPCILNSSFGFAGLQIWVNHGCRAKFGYRVRNYIGTIDRIVKCSSHNYKYAECNVQPGGLIKSIHVINKISNSPCVYGQSFGKTGSGSVWVNHGCRAYFVVNKFP